jgi:hypothetical protein
MFDRDQLGAGLSIRPEPPGNVVYFGSGTFGTVYVFFSAA